MPSCAATWSTWDSCGPQDGIFEMPPCTCRVSMLRVLRSSAFRATASPLRASFQRTMATSAGDKKFYILRYDYVSDILEKRTPFRAEHLQNAVDLKAQGKILMGGALVDPVDTGLFIFSTDNKAEIEEFVANDPYVKNNLVTAHSIREWAVAV